PPGNPARRDSNLPLAELASKVGPDARLSLAGPLLDEGNRHTHPGSQATMAALFVDAAFQSLGGKWTKSTLRRVGPTKRRWRNFDGTNEEVNQRALGLVRVIDQSPQKTKSAKRDPCYSIGLRIG